MMIEIWLSSAIHSGRPSEFRGPAREAPQARAGLRASPTPTDLDHSEGLAVANRVKRLCHAALGTGSERDSRRRPKGGNNDLLLLVALL
jgi:hypothetical protein